MPNARFQDVVLVTQAGSRAAELAGEFGQIETTPVAQLDAFQIAPNPLVRIQIGGVTGQGFQMDPLGCARGQKVFDDLAAMDWGAIPDDQELAGNVAQQVLEEAHDTGTIEGAGLD